ncbi:nucleotide-binding protein [Streptosporangium saharense]|uniref:Chromosome partitioning protein n=1 Tax=Streptosporangium saharense TaxID=1706840 RepID=A0A7W7VSQ3_9ACTN|nr:AAA family ATPase [Streptosporangium saharense]MBB4920983.1 chromosome partitioning protein [Streptosporangium saharense]
MTLSIALANLKPGTGKTTTSVLLAYALHRRGYDVSLADCDPAASTLAWSDAVSGFPFSVYGLAVKDAGKRLASIAGGPKTIIVVDLPQAEDHGTIVRSVLRRVDEITIPVAPSTIEIERTSAIADLLGEVAEVRDRPARVAVLLNRVVTSARSGSDARDALVELGYDVLQPRIPRREAYALAYGMTPDIRDGDPFDLLAETYLNRAGLKGRV